MHFIKKIFGNAVDDDVHQRFIRYGRGRFGGPIIEIEHKGKDLQISASEDYASEIIQVLLEAGGSNSTSGKILSKRDLSGVDGIVKKASSRGQHEFMVSGAIDPKEVEKIGIYASDVNILLDVRTDKGNLKTKKSLTKPGDVDESFCKAKINDSLLARIMDEFCFDVDRSPFKKIRIAHNYTIEKINIPSELMKDPALARIKAKREGYVERTITVDGKEKTVRKEVVI